MESQRVDRGGVVPAAVRCRFLFCYAVLGWQREAAEIGGIALSTTSVAVVYAVMVETGLNQRDVGKLILAACFITDLGTVLALGGLFANYGWLLAVFVATTAVTLLVWCCSPSAAWRPRPGMARRVRGS